MKTDFDISLILSGVKALIGEITSCIRAISIEVDNSKIRFKCVFDETANDEDYELMSAAATEIIADFPGYDLEEIFIEIVEPNKIEPLKNVLYQRHESNYWK